MTDPASVVNAGWIALAVGLTTALIVAATSWVARHRDPDLGTVRHQGSPSNAWDKRESGAFGRAAAGVGVEEDIRWQQ